MCYNWPFGWQPLLVHTNKYLGELWETKHYFSTVEVLSMVLKGVLGRCAKHWNNCPPSWWKRLWCINKCMYVHVPECAVCLRVPSYPRGLENWSPKTLSNTQYLLGEGGDLPDFHCCIVVVTVLCDLFPGCRGNPVPLFGHIWALQHQLSKTGQCPTCVQPLVKRSDAKMVQLTPFSPLIIR